MNLLSAAKYPCPTRLLLVKNRSPSTATARSPRLCTPATPTASATREPVHGGIGQRATGRARARRPRFLCAPAGGAGARRSQCPVVVPCPAVAVACRVCVRLPVPPPCSCLSCRRGLLLLCWTRGDPIADALLRSARWTDRTGLSLSHHLLGQQSKLSMV